MQWESMQAELQHQSLDGWLFFDHHRRDPLAYRVLRFTPSSPVTRRWFYFVPAHGQPRGLVHRIEAQTLEQLPGQHDTYAGWETLVQGLQSMLGGARRVAMQYSPNCAVPLVSMVDAGTIEMVRGLGIDVVSSADLIQFFESTWSQAQLESHLEAGRRIDRIRDDAFKRVSEQLRARQRVTEWEIAEFIRQRFAEQHLITDHGPDVAVNSNASNPHYEPTHEKCAEIRQGDTILIDMWAKLDQPGSVYYDITWVGFCGQNPSAEYQRVFTIVRDARDEAVQFVRENVAAGNQICGYQVDAAARSHIDKQGLGEFFFHRTGHSIGEDVHGAGANMDNLETHDERKIIPWTCFSVEPGIYLPAFGIRLEVDVFVGDGEARVTGEVQDKLILL